MSTRPLFPQLHALIGDAAHLLPADVAERVEVLLDDPRDLLPALLARMDGRDAADGQRLTLGTASGPLLTFLPLSSAQAVGLPGLLVVEHRLVRADAFEPQAGLHVLAFDEHAAVDHESSQGRVVGVGGTGDGQPRQSGPEVCRQCGGCGGRARGCC